MALWLYRGGAGFHPFGFAQDRLNYDIKYRMGQESEE